MKTNASWIIQLHSKDDHLVPVSAARFVRDKVSCLLLWELALMTLQLGTIYTEAEDWGHFQDETNPVLYGELSKVLSQ